MKRFEKAEVDDLVYCRKNGRGTIIATKALPSFPIRVLFETPLHDGSTREAYTLDGYMNSTDAEALLFYRSSTDNYLTERPEPEVDWANMPKYTLLECINERQGISATFLNISQQSDRVWILTQGEAKMAYLVPASKWKPKAKETPTCQKA